jgi:Lrp/AsnC family leucine-responsive transcriptional regulator
VLDLIDIKILKCLEKNSRINASIIGEQINMSVSAVIERIRKMETSGVIRKYTIVLDNKKINKDVSAYISVRLDHPRHNDDFVKAVGGILEVVECHYIAGDYDFLLKVITESTGTLTDLLNKIKSLVGVSLTRTVVVLSTTKDGQIVLPDIK